MARVLAISSLIASAVLAVLAVAPPFMWLAPALFGFPMNEAWGAASMIGWGLGATAAMVGGFLVSIAAIMASMVCFSDDFPVAGFTGILGFAAGIGASILGACSGAVWAPLMAIGLLMWWVGGA